MALNCMHNGFLGPPSGIRLSFLPSFSLREQLRCYACLIKLTLAGRIYDEVELGERISNFVSRNIFTKDASGLEREQKGQWNSPFYLPLYFAHHLTPGPLHQPLCLSPSSMREEVSSMPIDCSHLKLRYWEAVS